MRYLGRVREKVSQKWKDVRRAGDDIVVYALAVEGL